MKRSDGRSYDELRQVRIRRRYLKHAEASCLIEVGHTKVICSATVEESVPSFLRGTSTGWVTAEYGMLPRSTHSRISREKSRGGRTQEIQRLIGRSLRAIVDRSRLGERTITLDCDVIQADGGTRTASITGACVALVDCLYGLKEKGVMAVVPIKYLVAATSVGIVDGQARLDLTYDEDSHAEVDMNVVMVSDGRLVEVQGTAEQKPFKESEMTQMLKLARHGAGQLFEMQQRVLGQIAKGLGFSAKA